MEDDEQLFDYEPSRPVVGEAPAPQRNRVPRVLIAMVAGLALLLFGRWVLDVDDGPSAFTRVVDTAAPAVTSPSGPPAAPPNGVLVASDDRVEYAAIGTDDQPVTQLLVARRGSHAALDDGAGGMVVGFDDRIEWWRPTRLDPTVLVTAVEGSRLTLEATVPRAPTDLDVVYTQHRRDVDGFRVATVHRFNVEAGEAEVLVRRGELGPDQVVSITDVAMTESHFVFVQRTISNKLMLVVRDTEGEFVLVESAREIALEAPAAVALDNDSLAVLSGDTVRAIDLAEDTVVQVIDAGEGAHGVAITSEQLIVSGVEVELTDRASGTTSRLGVSGTATPSAARPSVGVFAND
jgi:hypothetical protein